MKLLIVTQRVDKDDQNLGAFYYWFEELAKRVETVVIIGDGIGNISLPNNTIAVSLGKDKGYSRLRRLVRLWHFFWIHYRQSDVVFFHQIPEYVFAAAPFLLFGRRNLRTLWYAHGAVTWKLRIAERLVDFVLSSSEAGFRLPSKKVVFLGQAIDTNRFAPSAGVQQAGSALRMITIGRIAPVKDYETIIRACAVLKKSWDREWTLSIVGGPLLERDIVYKTKLELLVKEHDLSRHIHFTGARPFSEIINLLQEHDLFLNVSRTGSLDKAVLEAMSVGLSVITANEAYRAILPPKYFLEHVSAEFLAERIKSVADEARPNTELRNIVVRDHGLEKLITLMTSLFYENLLYRKRADAK